MNDAEKAVILAHVAERAERYQEMAQFMTERVQKGGPLTAEERDLFSAAFKGALNGHRFAVRVAATMAAQETAEGHAHQASLALGYRSKVEAELKDVCDRALDVLKNHLVPAAEAGEPKAFYLKMQADYYRYEAEFAEADSASRQEIAQLAEQSYTEATQEAQANLQTTHPVRLGLALNFSVFQHEVLGETAAAVVTAQAALNNALADVAGLSEEASRDANQTIQLLRDNLELWSGQ